MSVVLVGTLDTKGIEVAYIRDRLLAAGTTVRVIDAGVLGQPAFPADVPREAVFQAAGVPFDEVVSRSDRGQAVALAATGVARVVAELHRQGEVSGVLSLGGSAGTTIGTAAMRMLPVGIPKVMVSTLASGQVQQYVGTRDVFMLYSVVDISGVNRISRLVLDNAAAAMAGMVKARQQLPTVQQESIKPLVAATMFGVTTPCVEAARHHLEAAGYEVLVFHATGTGGRTMEELIRDGLICGVLDITTTELADELVGGILSAGPDRLTAAGQAGIPQVISVGALDMVNFGPRQSVPAQFGDRTFYQHNPNVTLMRTTPMEMGMLGAQIAHKANAARGPTSVMIPRRGVSAIDAEGQPFWWPTADEILFDAIRSNVKPPVAMHEYDLHINDPSFAIACADVLLGMMSNRGPKITPSEVPSHSPS